MNAAADNTSMEMSPLTIPGQVPTLEQDGNPKPSSALVPLPTRKPSKAGSLRGTGDRLNSRMPTNMAGGVQPGAMIRKKLPWLEGQPTPTLRKTSGALMSSRPSLTVLRGSIATGEEGVRAVRKSLAEDPALRPTGSDPTLGDRARDVARSRTLSLSSAPRPGVRPIHSKQQARRALGVASQGRRRSRTEDYTPSEYSTTISSDLAHSAAENEYESRPMRKPDGTLDGRRLNRHDPASYEQLVQRFAEKKAAMALFGAHQQWEGLEAARKSERQRSLEHVPQWLQDQLMMPKSQVHPRSVKRRCDEEDSCQCSSAGEQSPLGDGPISTPESAYSPPGRAAGQSSRTGTGTVRPKPSDSSWRYRHAVPTPGGVPKRETLFELPNHLMAPSSSNSPEVPDHLRFTSTEPSSNSRDLSRTVSPPAMSAVLFSTATSLDNVSPKAPLRRALTSISPKASVDLDQMPPPDALRGAPQKLRRENRSLSRAITGLEDLMDEALTVAKDAADGGRSDDVKHILDEATAVLRKASTTIPNKRSLVGRGITTSPLQVSPHESGVSSDSDSDVSFSSSISSMRGGKNSIETLPTPMTKHSSSQPLVVQQPDGKHPSSLQASVENLSSSDSIAQTPPGLYKPVSAESIVRDFAYAKQRDKQRTRSAPSLSATVSGYGLAADYYQDHGESVAAQPGVRHSIAMQKALNKPLPALPDPTPTYTRPLPRVPAPPPVPPRHRHGKHHVHTHGRRRASNEPLIPAPLGNQDGHGSNAVHIWHHHQRDKYHPHLSDLFEAPYYHNPEADHARAALFVEDRKRSSVAGLPKAFDPQDDLANDDLVGPKRPIHSPHLSDLIQFARTRRSERDFERVEAHSAAARGIDRKISSVTDTRSVPPPSPPLRRSTTAAGQKDGDEDSTKQLPRKHISLNEGQGFSLGRYHRRQPIAREWTEQRKRLTATIACANTVFIGLIAGIYAGEVPKIQYRIQDYSHKVILGNVLLFIGLALTTLIFWPLPLLHGRKPYTLLAFALMLPLQFPQALAVSGYRDPKNPLFRCGLLIPRVFTGLAMGFANINQLPTL